MSDLPAPIAADREGPARSPRRADGIARNAAYAFAAQLATAAFSAVLILFLVRRLGPSSYGLFALALSIGGFVILPADLGISGSVARLIARARDDERTSADVLADAVRLKAATTGVASLALFLLAGPVAGVYGDEALVWPVRIVALSLFAESTLGMLTGVFIAFGRVSVNLYVLLTESALEAGTSIVIVLLGGGAAGALAGRAAAYSFACALALVLAARHVGPWAHRLGGRSAGQVRAIAGYAAALALVEGSWIVFAKIDGLLIGAFLDPRHVGLFQAPIRLVAFLAYLGYALAAGIAPTLARPESARPEAFARALRYLAIVQAAVVVPLVVWAEPIVRLLLGSQFASSATVLQAIAPYVFLAGFAPLVSMAVDYLGDARKRIPITLATVAVNVVLDVILIPRIGIVGAAIGTDIAFAIYVPAHLWLCARRIGLDLRPLAATLARLSVAAAAAAAVLAGVGRETLSAVDWIGGGGLAAAAFACTLLLLGEVSFRDIRRLQLRQRLTVRRSPQAHAVAAAQPRLIHLVTYASPYSGAVVAMVRAVARAAGRRGWATDVVLPAQARGRRWLDLLEDDGVTVHLIDAGSRRATIRAVQRLLGNDPAPVVLHTHSSRFDLPVLAATRRRRDTVVFWHVHSFLQPQLRFRITSRIRFGLGGRLVDRILCVSPRLAGQVVARGAPRAKVVVYPSGIDIESFSPVTAHERLTARRKLGLPVDAEILLHFARDWHVNGGDLCLEALAELHRRGRRAVAVTVGGMAQAAQAANELGLGSAVVPMPAREDVQLLFAATDVFVSPSRFEGTPTPTAVLQALACGVPVVATRPAHAGADSLPLLLLAETEPRSLADAIQYALATRHDHGAERLAAHEWVRTHADLDGWAEHMIELYEEALASS